MIDWGFIDDTKETQQQFMEQLNEKEAVDSPEDSESPANAPEAGLVQQAG